MLASLAASVADRQLTPASAGSTCIPAVLTPGAQRTLLSCTPPQPPATSLNRYSLHGPLLWPKAQQPQPSRCAHCGGPRVFELQLMPALIHLTIEAAQMALDQGMRVDAAGGLLGGCGVAGCAQLVVVPRVQNEDMYTAGRVTVRRDYVCQPRAWPA